MYLEPIPNDPQNPLISVLIYNYNGRYLRDCFDSILTQTFLDNIEIIFIDDSTMDGAWDIALEYSRNFPSLITLNQNRRCYGPSTNFRRYNRMAKGKYFVTLCYEQKFLPEHIKECVRMMESDPSTNFSVVRRKIGHETPRPAITNKPLVSITLHNYNYGRYLTQCFDSVFAQTYDYYEICFSDNASVDDSWDIAIEYAKRYPGKIYLTRNRRNFGPDFNFANCLTNATGKYLVELCSDDALEPDFLEKCVHAMESHPETGFCMVHRAIIDENGKRTEEPPFYNQTCLIPGPEQAAVYMMASVNPSISQIMYRKELTMGKAVVGSLAGSWYGTRIMDFNMCCEYPILYIKEPLLLHRIHSQNDSFRVAENLMEIIGPYILQHQFAELAAPYNLTKVIDRLPPSLEKLGRLCLRYSMRALCSNNEIAAGRYFHLSAAITPDIKNDSTFKLINDYWVTDDVTERSKIIESLKSVDNLAARNISYDPPPGSTPVGINPPKRT